MKDRDLFTAAGIAAIAGGILAYSIVTNDEVPVVAPTITAEEQLEAIIKASPDGVASCENKLSIIGLNPAENLWECNGVNHPSFQQFLTDRANGEKFYKVDVTSLRPPPAK
jgi:hypothetical protein